MNAVSRTFPLPSFDPLALHLRLAPEGPGLLESASLSPRTGRCSIVPLRRTESYRLDGRGLARIDDRGETFLDGDPFAALSAILETRRIAAPSVGAFFPGGFFGYLSYDFAGRIERLPHRALRDRPVPELWLDWVDLTAVYDYRQHTLTLASLDPDEDLAALEREVRHSLASPLPPPAAVSSGRMRPQSGREAFCLLYTSDAADE